MHEGELAVCKGGVYEQSLVAWLRHEQQRAEGVEQQGIATHDGGSYTVKRFQRARHKTTKAERRKLDTHPRTTARPITSPFPTSTKYAHHQSP